MSITHIKKRDGTVVLFNEHRISNAIQKALSATNKGTASDAINLTNKTVQEINKLKDVPSVEDIQNIVERILIEDAHPDVAKAYIVYRKERDDTRNLHEALMNVEGVMDGYLEKQDWRVNENSNVTYSISGLMLHSAGSVIANYTLTKVYPKKIGYAHKSGDFHIHDLSMGISGYCSGWSLKQLVMEGFNGVPGKINSVPAKHLNALTWQMINFIGTLQNEWAGAQAFSSFDTYLAPFIKKDNLTESEVHQILQGFIFNMNVPSRWGSQTPFSNITLDWNVPNDMKNIPAIVGGKPQSFTYGDCQKEMDILNKVFIELMTKGDASGRIFTFPIPTYNITKDFDWNHPNAELLFKMTGKYGLPYFCLDADTKVITEIGTKKIRDIVKKDRLLGEDGAFYNIKSLIKHKHNEGISLNTSKGKICCSLNHRFPTKQGLKFAEELSIKDKLFSYTKKITFENGFKLSYANSHLFRLFDENDDEVNFKDINHKNLKKFYKLKPKKLHFRKITKFKNIPNRFQTTLRKIRIPEQISDNIFEVIGQLLGDGRLYGGSVRLTNADKEVLDFFSNVIKKEFGLDVKVRETGKSKICKDYSVYSITLKNFLEHIGVLFTNGGNKKIPDIVYSQNKNTICALLRGLFDTDGSAYINRCGNTIIKLILKNQYMTHQVMELLMILGIGAYYKEDKRGYGILTLHGKRNIRLFKEKIGFRIKRKMDKIILKKTSSHPSIGNTIVNKESYLKEIKYDIHYKYKKEAFFRINESNDKHLFLFVRNIEEKQDEINIISLQRINKKINTIDITMKNSSHLFVLGNGIVTHNSNFINSDMNPSDVRSMCCRLRLDRRELIHKGGGLFGAGELTGSIGVVTINMPRIGYLAKTEEEFLERLGNIMDMAKESLEIKRKVVAQNLERGLMPYSMRYLGNLKNHFSTIGLTGLNEACLNLLEKDIASPEGRTFALKTLDFMRERISDYQTKTDNLFNLEATPAEGTSYRLARIDKKMYPKIITAGQNEFPYYTNSSQLPVGYTDDVFEALKHQDKLQCKYTGGTVLHCFVGEKIHDWKACRDLVKKIAYNFKLPYYTITPTFSICPVHGYVPGEHTECPNII